MGHHSLTDRDIVMKGGGYYSLAAAGAKKVIDSGAPLIFDALASMDIRDSTRPFTVADIGCTDGGTSLELIGKLLKEVRKRVPSRPMQMIYTDLPRNDYSQLFQLVHGYTDVPSYLIDIPNLYVYASATSQHEMMFPPQSVDFAFSSTTTHYISARPCNISDHIHMVGARGAERAAYEAQGCKDWEALLFARAKELVSGGRFVCFNLCIDEKGRYSGYTEGVNVLDTFNEIWRGFAEDGVIRQAEYLNTNFPQCCRTVEQFTAPFADPANPVPREGLRLDRIETRIVACPFAEEFARNKDVEKFARDYVRALRSWSENVFISGLSRKRLIGEKRDIVDRLYDVYEERVRSAPKGHRLDYVHAYMTCSKK